ncbi:MAG: OmpA family protein, partial [Peptococcaceae bacterium]|nr:OmpA family protein [Peptococcaceae bacterium]
SPDGIYARVRSGDAFDTVSLTPTPALHDVLDHVINVFRDNPANYRIIVEGHTDNSPPKNPEKNNDMISLERAENVMNILTIAKGYFIGSGAIESGNKIVLQQRLKQASMRWNVSSAQPMLTLKTKCESNLWEKDAVIPFTSKHVGQDFLEYL